MSGYRFLVNSASSSWDTSQVRVSTVIYPFVYMFRHVYSTIGIGSLLTALPAPTSLQVRVAVRWSVTHLELLWGDLWLTWRCCEVKCDSPGGAVRWSVTHLELLWGEVWLTWSCCEVKYDSPGAAVRWFVTHLELLWGDLWLTWSCCEVKCVRWRRCLFFFPSLSCGSCWLSAASLLWLGASPGSGMWRPNLNSRCRKTTKPPQSQKYELAGSRKENHKWKIMCTQ